MNELQIITVLLKRTAVCSCSVIFVCCCELPLVFLMFCLSHVCINGGGQNTKTGLIARSLYWVAVLVFRNWCKSVTFPHHHVTVRLPGVAFTVLKSTLPKMCCVKTVNTLGWIQPALQQTNLSLQPWLVGMISECNAQLQKCILLYLPSPTSFHFQILMMVLPSKLKPNKSTVNIFLCYQFYRSVVLRN